MIVAPIAPEAPRMKRRDRTTPRNESAGKRCTNHTARECKSQQVAFHMHLSFESPCRGGVALFLPVPLI